jgi:anti-sigma-K factor RskA
MEKWRRKKTAASWRRRTAAAVAVMVLAVVAAGVVAATDKATPQRILLDTDMDTDDLLALMYLLKQNRSEFELKVFSSTRSSLLLHVRS